MSGGVDNMSEEKMTEMWLMYGERPRPCPFQRMYKRPSPPMPMLVCRATKREE